MRTSRKRRSTCGKLAVVRRGSARDLLACNDTSKLNPARAGLQKVLLYEQLQVRFSTCLSKKQECLWKSFRRLVVDGRIAAPRTNRWIPLHFFPNV